MTSPDPKASVLDFDIEGMHCASCSSRVEEALRKQPGVRQASVNLALSRARVALAPDGSLWLAEDSGGSYVEVQ